MRIHEKIYTFMIGSQDPQSEVISFAINDSSDSNGIPEAMFIENNGVMIENRRLYHVSEELLRKAIKRGFGTNSPVSKCYLCNIVYDDSLSLTSTNTSLLYSLTPFCDFFNSRMKDVNTGKTLDVILKEHYIKTIHIFKESKIPIYGSRDVLYIEFLPEIKTIANLSENIPDDCACMDNLVDFLKIAKNAIVCDI